MNQRRMREETKGMPRFLPYRGMFALRCMCPTGCKGFIPSVTLHMSLLQPPAAHLAYGGPHAFGK